MNSSLQRILVVDDDELIYEQIRCTLARTGHTVSLAHDGETGLARAAELCPAVIVLDVHMPHMDGHAFLRRLAALDLDAAVIATSVTGEIDDVLEMLRSGAVDFIRKPWPMIEMVGALMRALAVFASRTPTLRSRPSLVGMV